MTPDHPDRTPDETPEFGILPDVSGVDTAAIGFLGAATAQVSVTLPTAEEDDLSDDDVIGDEVVFDDNADDADADADDAAEVDADAADEVDAVNEADDTAEVDAVGGADDTADVDEAGDADDTAEVGAGAEADAAAEADVDGKPEADEAETEPVDEAETEPVDEAETGSAPEAETGSAPEAEIDIDGEHDIVVEAEPSAAAAADENAAGDDASDAIDADLVTDESDTADWQDDDEPFDRVAFAALIDDTIARYAHGESAAAASKPDAAAAAASEPDAAEPAASDPVAADPDDAEPEDVIIEDGRPEDADFEASDSAYHAVDPEPVDAEPIEPGHAAGAPEEASMNDTPTGRDHDVERVHTRRPEITLTSKRLDEFDSGKESSDLLTADRLLERGKMSAGEPEGTWQHFVYSISGGRINLGDGKRARARKELTGRIAAPLSGGARFVPVLSRKGGVGKTTITTLLGMALADARDDRIIAIDANPDRGTLAERIARPSTRTVRDLARMQGDITGFNDISTIVARDETRLDVLASDSDPRVSEAFSDADYRDVADIAAHYYSIVLTDTGTGIVHSVMGATLGMADQLVVVSGLSIDEARLASETLTWLETNGFAELVRSGIVVLNNARPGAPLVREDELETHFATRVRSVVRMPYDPLIATGSAITFHDLQPATREAARHLAVTVVEGLRENTTAAA
ncbi:MinD/ParA family protein [Microbacterium sp.]|uniref:MinD/ParA family ATP-binding protein n=1 Tax=Microbacterium sp. TaxID=51671 RepID=UPI003A8CE78E